MGKKSAPSPPPAPDPYEVARADAMFNRINQQTPFGNLTFLGPNRNTAQLTLTPEMQELVNQRTQSDLGLIGAGIQRQSLLNEQPIDLSQFGPIQSNIDTTGINFGAPTAQNLPGVDLPLFGQFQGQAPALQQGIDASGLPPLPQNLDAMRANVEDAFFQRGQRLLDPVFQDQERALRQRLATQGLPESGEAFDRDLTRFSDARNRAFQDLAANAVLTGGQESSRAIADALSVRGQGFGQQLAAGQFGNQALQQGLQNQLALTDFNNRVGAQNFGAQVDLRNLLADEQLAFSGAQNAAAAQNLALQQQLLQNQNASRTQALNEQLGIRGNQFNELAALLGLQQVQPAQLNSFFGPGQVDFLGAQALNQQAQQNAFNAQLQQQQGMLGGLFGLGSALITAGGSATGGIPGLFGFG